MTQTRHLVVGLGQSGLSACLYLHRTGLPFVVNDSRLNPPGLAQLKAAIPDVECHVGAWHESLVEACETVVVSPGVALSESIIVKARSLNRKVLGDIQMFADACQAPVIGITGTNGKSTVTTLVAELLKAQGLRVLAGGNLGMPALDLLKEPVPDVYVLELSSYQLESTTHLALTAASVLNVSPDHMDRYKSLADYAAAKARIFAHAELAVLNRDDTLVCAMQPKGVRSIFFSESDNHSDFYLNTEGPQTYIMHADSKLITTDTIALKGRHNHLNVLAALALVEPFAVSHTAIQKALQQFTGLAHRSQVVEVINGVTYVNDSKGTNVGATVAAIQGAPAPLVLIAGGDGKGQDFSELATACAKRVKHVVLLGKDASSIAKALDGVCAYCHVETLEQAVSTASEIAVCGDWVLLSPACASLDMFSSYVERGERFARAVRGLP